MIEQTIENLVKQARQAQIAIEGYSQQQLDQLTHAVAWAVMEPNRNKELSELACAETGLGKVADKQVKNYRKTLGLLRDLKGKVSTGLLREDKALGISEYARPVGVVGALVPSTNPVATPINKIINALKCGNAIIVAPSPKGVEVFTKLLDYIHQEFAKINAPKNLVQAMPKPPSKEATNALMKKVDLVVVTGSQNNVRGAYSSGTFAIGVGTGNVTTIIDETANCQDAAEKICRSKTFDNGTSCSSENNIICHRSLKQEFCEQLQKQGGYLLSPNEQQKLVESFWQDGQLNKNLIAKDALTIAEKCGLNVPPTITMLVTTVNEIHSSEVLLKERMAPILSLLECDSFLDALGKAKEILTIQGAGHSVGIHTNNIEQQARIMAQKLPTCRVIVNQAHAIATGGSFDNGMPFSLSMGCGSWGKNSIDGNMNYKHFMNVTKIVRPIKPNEPHLEEVMGDYLKSFQ